MAKDKITLHRALSELKVIESRIMKKIADFHPCGTSKEGKLIDGLHDALEFKKSVQSKYISIVDLMDRRVKIRAALSVANATTIVEIAGLKMTISEAIAAKNYMTTNRELIQNLRMKYNGVKGQVNKHNEQVDENAFTLAKTMLSNPELDKSSPKIKEISADFYLQHEVKMADPLDVVAITEAAESELDEFDDCIDSALSEINAVTFIEV